MVSWPNHCWNLKDRCNLLTRTAQTIFHGSIRHVLCQDAENGPVIHSIPIKLQNVWMVVYLNKPNWTKCCLYLRRISDFSLSTSRKSLVYFSVLVFWNKKLFQSTDPKQCLKLHLILPNSCSIGNIYGALTSFIHILSHHNIVDVDYRRTRGIALYVHRAIYV